MIKSKSHSGHNGQLLTLKQQSKQARHAGKMQRVEPQTDACRVRRLVPIGRLRAHWKNVEKRVEDAFQYREAKAVSGIGERYAYKSCLRELELLHVGIRE